MLLTRELYTSAHLEEVFAGRASAVDYELGEAAILSTASVGDAAESLIVGLEQRHSGAAAVLVGHSYGGYVALEVARRAPQRLAGLVLMSTQSRCDTKGAAARRQKQVDLARSAGIQTLIDGILPALLSPKAQADATIVDAVRRMAEQTGVEHFAQQMRACSERADQRTTVQELDPRIPVLVVGGQQDKLIPPKCARELGEGLKVREDMALAQGWKLAPWRVRSHTESGHLLALEQPEALRAYLASWADEVHTALIWPHKLCRASADVRVP